MMERDTTWNITIYNMTVLNTTIISYDSAFQQRDPDLSIIVSVGCLIPAYIFATWIFIKCKKIVKNLRFWIQCVLLSNMASFVCFVVSRLVLSFTAQQTTLQYRVLDGITRTGIFAGILSTLALGCEQLFSLMFPMEYQRYVTTIRRWIFAGVILLFSIIPSTTVFIGEVSPVGPQESLQTTNTAAWTSCLIMVITATMTLTVHSVVGCFAFNKRRNTQSPGQNNDYSRFTKITAKSLLLVILYVVLVLPAYVVDLVCLVHGDCFEWADNFVLAKQIMTMAFYFGMPIMFVAIFPESRYILMSVLCCCNAEYCDQLEMEYKQNYATYELATIQRRTSRDDDGVRQFQQNETQN